MPPELASDLNSAEPTESAGRQICIFRVGSRYYGLDVLDVREINTELGITPVDHAPDGVRGLANVRGQIFLIVDAGVLLQGEAVKSFAASRVVLLKDHVGPSVGLLVDEIDEIEKVSADEITTLTDVDKGRSGRSLSGELTGGVPDAFVLGVCKLPDRLVVVLQARHLLDAFTP